MDAAPDVNAMPIIEDMDAVPDVNVTSVIEEDMDAVPDVNATPVIEEDMDAAPDVNVTSVIEEDMEVSDEGMVPLTDGDEADAESNINVTPHQRRIQFADALEDNSVNSAKDEIVINRGNMGSSENGIDAGMDENMVPPPPPLAPQHDQEEPHQHGQHDDVFLMPDDQLSLTETDVVLTSPRNDHYEITNIIIEEEESNNNPLPILT